MAMYLNKNRKKSIWLVVLILLLILVVAFFFYRRHTSSQVTVPTPTTGGASVNESKGELPKPADTPNISSNQNSDSAKAPSVSNATLIAPSGNFVSNHHPNLSGSPAPNTITSVCTTTPGATCTISFSKDGTTKSLPAQTTDKGGSSYWNNWSLQDIGLTAGTWKIKATSTLGDKSLSTSDTLDLVVSQ